MLRATLYDGQGFWLCLKRFSQGRLQAWPAQPDQPLTPLAAQQLYVLLYNGTPAQAHFTPDWRALPST